MKNQASGMLLFTRSPFRFTALILIVTAGCAPASAGAPEQKAVLLHHLATVEVPAKLAGGISAFCVGYGSFSDEALIDPDQSVMGALTAAGVRAQVVSECELPINTARVTDRVSGERRILLVVKEVGSTGEFEAQYYYGGNAGAGWHCAFRKNEGTAFPPVCELIWDS